MNTALYARVSSTAQDVDLSIGAQLNALKKYAAERGHDVVKEYVDQAESGRTANRPVFQQMISDARSKPAPFDAVLVWKLSRFARNREDSILYKGMLRRRGIDVISITEPVEPTPAGLMMEGIIETVDEFYSANMAQDITRGMREAASRGFWVSSKTPYGYRRIKVSDGVKQRTRLDINKTTAGIVGVIFDMAKTGIGTKEIAKRLNHDGVPSPAGKKWGRSRIHFILTNPVYKGTIVFGERGSYHRKTGLDPVRVDSAVPALVPQDDFDRLQSQLRSRAPSTSHPRRTTSRFMLSNLLRCGSCGAKMVGKSAKSGRYDYYVCGTSERTGTCDASPLPKSDIEQAVLQRILNVVLNEPNLERLIELTNEELRTSQMSSMAMVRTIDEQLGDIRSRLAKLYEAIETGVLTLSDLAPRVKELRQSELELTEARTRAHADESDVTERLIDRETILVYLRDLKSLVSAGTAAQRKTFLSGFVETLTVTGSEIEIEYSLPVPHEQTAELESGVLPITLFGGA